MSPERISPLRSQLQAEPGQAFTFDSREKTIKRVFNIINTEDTGILINMANRLRFNSDSKRDEAVQHVRDHVTELLVRAESSVNWDDFVANIALRVKIYRNALIDFNRHNSRKTFHIEDGSSPSDERLTDPGHEQAVTSKLDLDKILAIARSEKGKVSTETREKFIIILKAILQGKTAREIILENNWDILTPRVTQIFQQTAALLRRHYPDFPTSIEKLKEILNIDRSDESKIEAVRHIVRTLREEEQKLLDKMNEHSAEYNQLKERLVCVRSILVSEPEFTAKSNALRRRIWQELFPDMIFTDWNQLIRKIVKTENL